MDLYYMPASAPCRSVMMAAKAVNVKLNLIKLDLQKGEHLKVDFLKINPQHCVPTLVDNNFSLWESRAILVYIVQKYGKNDSLYPKDVKKRAVINQRLYFDAGTLFKSFYEYLIPMFHQQAADEEKLKAVQNAIGLLNIFLEGHDFAAGDSLSIADFAILSTISTVDAVGFDMTDYPNVTRWFENCKETVKGYNECNEEGLEIIKAMLGAHKHADETEPAPAQDDSPNPEDENEKEPEDEVPN